MFQDLVKPVGGSGSSKELESLIPEMTSNNAPTGYSAYGSTEYGSGYGYFSAFSNTHAGWAPNTNAANQWVGITLPEAEIVKGLIYFGSMGAINSNTLALYGSNDSGTPTNWTPIIENISLGKYNAIHYIVLDNNDSYKSYKFGLATGFNLSGAYGMKYQLLG